MVIAVSATLAKDGSCIENMLLGGVFAASIDMWNSIGSRRDEHNPVRMG
jgi:hypothetical protein